MALSPHLISYIELTRTLRRITMLKYHPIDSGAGGYPESQPPSPSLEFDPWPKGGDAFARRVTQE